MSDGDSETRQAEAPNKGERNERLQLRERRAVSAERLICVRGIERIAERGEIADARQRERQTGE